MPRYFWLIGLAFLALVGFLLWADRAPPEPAAPARPVLRHPWPVSRRQTSDGGREWRPHLDKAGLQRRKEEPQ